MVAAFICMFYSYDVYYIKYVSLFQEMAEQNNKKGKRKTDDDREDTEESIGVRKKMKKKK